MALSNVMLAVLEMYARSDESTLIYTPVAGKKRRGEGNSISRQDEQQVKEKATTITKKGSDI